MEEEVIVLAVLGFVLLLVIGAVFGWVAWLRSRSLARRLEFVELRLRELQRAPAAEPAPRASVAPSSPAAAQAPAAESESRAFVAPRAPATAHAPAAEPPVRPAPVTPVAPVAPVAPAREPAPAAPIPAHAPEAREAPPLEPRIAPAAPPPLPPPAPEKPRIEWERWIGVRGAAVLGAVFLIVAGFLFLQYSIDRGWLTPEVRLLVGAVTGILCIAGARPLRQREYGVLANSLSGAGVVLLYGVAWAAHRLFGVVEFLPAFAGMVAVTVTCAWLAHRHSSQLIAVLGLLGGFATPLVLSTGVDRPLGLFGYALLVDLGFLFVAHRRRWPTVGMVALGGTFVVQGLWIATNMDAPELALGVGALIVFGLVFAVFSALQPAQDRPRWMPAQLSAVFLPFAFAIYFSTQVQFGFHLAPLAVLAAVMTLAGSVLAVLQRTPALFFGSALAGVLLVAVWTLSNASGLDPARARELVLCALALGALDLGLAEWERRRRPGERAFALAASIGCLGLLAACAFALVQSTPHALPWCLAALVPLELALLRLQSAGIHAAPAALGALATGGFLAAWSQGAAIYGAHPGALAFAATVLAVALALLAAARLSGASTRRNACFAVAAFFPFAFAAVASPPELVEGQIAPLLGLEFALGFALALAATGARSALVLAAAIGLTFWSQLELPGFDATLLAPSSHWTAVMLTLAAGAAVFALWPFFAPKSLTERAGAWRVAAVASLPWFPVLQDLWLERFADKFAFALPLAFAFALGLCALALWRRPPPELSAEQRAAEPDPARAAQMRTASIAREWFGATALACACVALPMHVDPRATVRDAHPVAVSLALWALALAWWWRLCDHRGLKVLSAVAAVLAVLELLSAAAFDTHASAERRVFNFQAWWLLLPALALLAAAFATGPLELARARGVERTAGRFPVAASVQATCALLLLFAWLNLEVADAFGDTQSIRWSFRGEPAVNLAQSIAWALFALALLVAGTSRSLGALRWASLGLFLITIAKVFLFDLAHLRGLHRVASMLGLAVALLLVSFLYQRFVFRRVRSAE